LQEADYEIKQNNKYISFRANVQERFTRAKTLGDNYTEERIKARILNKETPVIVPPNNSFDIRQVIDIEGNEKIKSNPGYEQWARIFNLKESAKTLLYLQENNMADVDKFNDCYKISVNNFFSQKRIKDKFLRKNDGAERDIALHKAAKKYFNDYTAKHGKPLPKMADVTAQIKSLKSSLPQKESDYTAAKVEYDNMVKLKVNLQSLLGKNSVKDYSYER
jgi:hypothetical protein